MKNQKGITLIETVITVLIFSFIVLIACKQYKSLVIGFKNSQQVTQLQIDSRDALNLISREIRNTGCKIFLTNDAGKIIKNIDELAFVSDSSSFIHKQGDPSDTLLIYKSILSSTGERDSTDSIEYYLENSSLIRKRNNQVFKFSKNIHALQFQYGIYTSDSMIYDIDPLPTTANLMVSNNSGITPIKTVAGSDVCFDFSGEAQGMIYYNTSFVIPEEMKLNVKINMRTQKSFIDSLHCSILQNSIVKGFEKFKPTNKIQELVFVSDPTNTGKLAIKYWVKGPGKMIISGFEISKEDLGTYVWTFNVPANKKRYVKAIKIHMLSRSTIGSGFIEETPLTIADITFNRSGQYYWRSIEETVETFNNGRF
jgi:type II secretory pathway component PulJ